jgi:integrase
MSWSRSRSVAGHDPSRPADRFRSAPLDKAKESAGLDALEERLSIHALRHSFATLLATDLVAPTTLAQLIGHADVLTRAASAGICS